MASSTQVNDPLGVLQQTLNQAVSSGKYAGRAHQSNIGNSSFRRGKHFVRRARMLLKTLPKDLSTPGYLKPSVHFMEL